MLSPRLVLAVLTAAAALAAAPSAFAGVATYDSPGPLQVPDSTGPGGVTSTITVPPGRTPIQSVEVANFRIGWAASAQELSTQLVGPDGTSLFLFTQGCLSYDAVDVWTFSDSATQTAPNSKNDPKCDLPGGTFKPTDVFPTFKTLSIFSGKPAEGSWTLRAVDNGVAFTNQGTILSWAVRVVHAPPSLIATAPPSLNATGPLAVTAQANANGTVTTGGDVPPSTRALVANVPTAVPFTLTGPVSDQVRQQGRAVVNINLAFTDETGDTASSRVSVEVRGNPAVKKKCKKKKRRAASSVKKKCKKGKKGKK